MSEKPQKFKLVQDVTGPENKLLKQGTEVYACTAPTYGCIGRFGIAVTLDPGGGYPFFEVLPFAVVKV